MKFYKDELECCPKTTCKNNGSCKACIMKHKLTDSLPYCMFPDNDGDKSLRHFYEKLGEYLTRNNNIQK